MKPREFLKIMMEYVDEDRRWRALKAGDTIYEEVGRGDSFDYHKMIIDEINLEEREVIAHDASPIVNFHNAKLGCFLTEFEFMKTQFKHK
jgi:hypothetical protein